ncbi:hypothetical protein MTO96_025604 [Rhipicephalus appendiculatus]
MLSNSLCLALQVSVLLLGEGPAVRTVFPGLARDDDVTSSGWHGEAWLSSPEDNRCCIEETTPLFITVSTWNHCRVMSVPVITSEPLNPRAGSFHGSGLVSSREGNMLSNPLCLALQVSVLLLGEGPAVKGKSYAAAVGAPSKVVETSTHPRQPGAEQRRPPSGPKKQGPVKPRLPTKATSESHLDQENTNLRLLLRAVADLLPLENQLRSICLQAGGVPPPNSHHG